MIRSLQDRREDYDYLYKWYLEKEVYGAFEQRSLSYDEIVRKYKPRTKVNSVVKVFMIEYENKPIGIVQYQKLSEENKKLYRIYDDDVYEIDIFIGDTRLHNKGIGQNVINEMTKYLFNNLNAKKIVMCPLKDNLKAINCYKKCGYLKSGLIKTNDTIGQKKEYILMIRSKEM